MDHAAQVDQIAPFSEDLALAYALRTSVQPVQSKKPRLIWLYFARELDPYRTHKPIRLGKKTSGGEGVRGKIIFLNWPNKWVGCSSYDPPMVGSKRNYKETCKPACLTTILVLPPTTLTPSPQ